MRVDVAEGGIAGLPQVRPLGGTGGKTPTDTSTESNTGVLDNIREQLHNRTRNMSFVYSFIGGRSLSEG